MPAGDQAFPKKNRLTKRPQYLQMGRDARRLHTRHFVILWQPNQLPHNRLGITVTKKVAGAVGRNRLKRLIRETFRRTGDMGPRGLDLVVIAKKGSAQMEGAGLHQELRQALTSLAGPGQGQRPKA
jgi:ribonuclease P protein component